jgi:hypothetical protein
VAQGKNAVNSALAEKWRLVSAKAGEAEGIPKLLTKSKGKLKMEWMTTPLFN